MRESSRRRPRSKQRGLAQEKHWRSVPGSIGLVLTDRSERKKAEYQAHTTTAEAEGNKITHVGTKEKELSAGG